MGTGGRDSAESDSVGTSLRASPLRESLRRAKGRAGEYGPGGWWMRRKRRARKNPTHLKTRTRTIFTSAVSLFHQISHYSLLLT